MDKPPLGCLSRSGIIIAIITTILLSAVLMLQGSVFFSPGPLNTKAGNPLAGVTSHAGLGGRCSACHAPFWSGPGMANLCMNCHADISAQQFDLKTLHGSLVQGGMSGSCWTCHPEHRGANASITFVDPAHFSHDKLGYPKPFPLTGRHIGLACTRCHVNNIFTNTPNTCVACHSEPASHLGQFGTDCAQCHSTSNWNATFDHPNSCGEGGCLHHHRATCADCHPVDFKTATCTKCHSSNNPGGGDGGGGD